MAFYDTKNSQYGMASATDQMIKAQQKLGEAQAKNAALASQTAASIIEKLGAIGAKAYGDYAEDKKQKASRAGLAKALNLNEEQTKAFVDGGNDALSAIASAQQIKAVNDGYILHKTYSGDTEFHRTGIPKQEKNPSKYATPVDSGVVDSLRKNGMLQDQVKNTNLVFDNGAYYWSSNLSQKDIDSLQRGWANSINTKANAKEIKEKKDREERIKKEAAALDMLKTYGG